MDIGTWRKQLAEPSGNLTTNAAMPAWIADTLLKEAVGSEKTVVLVETIFPRHEEPMLSAIDGLHILDGLQSKVREGYLTLFRAVRFPTEKRIVDLLTEGFTVSNYEQERILELYRTEDYIQKRERNQLDERFWIQPQERVVDGIPLFALANDAIQIHCAFRGQEDQVALAILHIPRQLLESGKIQLIANAAIDLDYKNADRDVSVRDFREKDGTFEIDYPAMRARGVDLHEMYTKDLPLKREDIESLGIEQEFYLLDLYELQDVQAINALEAEAPTLKKYRRFLHGFFGDQNIFGRRRAKYLPYKCFRLSLGD